MEDKLQEMIDKFNNRIEKDEKLRKNLEGIERKIMLIITDGDTYNFELRDLKLSPLSKGEIPDADVTITTDTETMTGLLDGTIKPMKAYATKKISFKASVRDMLLLKKLLS